MDYLTLPLRIVGGSMSRESNLKRSIDTHLSLLIATPAMACAADPGYGFVFNNFRFNIFNENEGVVFDSQPQILYDYEIGMYDRKLSGKSQNVNTFAAELNATISNYEPRLRDVRATMTYIRDEKRVYVSVKGVIVDTGEEYSFNTMIKAWN